MHQHMTVVISTMQVQKNENEQIKQEFNIYITHSH